MRRLVSDALTEWTNDENRKVLLLRGARQVGKTFIVRELAKEFNLPVCYDMQYLAVAELEDCELWTCDKSLVNSLKDKVKRIRWVGETQ